MAAPGKKCDRIFTKLTPVLAVVQDSPRSKIMARITWTRVVPTGDGGSARKRQSGPNWSAVAGRSDQNMAGFGILTRHPPLIFTRKVDESVSIRKSGLRAVELRYHLPMHDFPSDLRFSVKRKFA